MTGLVSKTISLSVIDPEDLCFRFSTERDDAGLLESIRRSGILSPVVLQEREDGRFRIVSGFRRVSACARLGMDRVSALVAGPDADFDDLAFLAASENASQRPLNIMEQARCVALLGRGLPFTERAGLIKAAIGLTAGPRHLEQLESLCNLPGFIRDALEKGALPLATAIQLGDFDPKCAFSLTRLFSELKLSLSKQREILEALGDIAGRDGITVAEVLALPEVAGTWENEQDRGLAAGRLREKLKSMRFPNLTEAENRLREDIRALKLPEGVFWEPPAFFEADTHTLRIAVKSAADLEKLRGLADAILQNPAITGIFP
ncbi:MAG: ParB N-terminal domain-containing protein [Deltaproteobacteria bacterium]|nr:ParB N-terminal domain-containing protein [Deltaproteobacteria bacterium]